MSERGTARPARSAGRAILWGGLICGVLDISSAVIISIANGGSPVRMLQGIAGASARPGVLREGRRHGRDGSRDALLHRVHGHGDLLLAEPADSGDGRMGRAGRDRLGSRVAARHVPRRHSAQPGAFERSISPTSSGPCRLSGPCLCSFTSPAWVSRSPWRCGTSARGPGAPRRTARREIDSKSGLWPHGGPS